MIPNRRSARGASEGWSPPLLRDLGADEFIDQRKTRSSRPFAMGRDTLPGGRRFEGVRSLPRRIR